MKNKIITMLEIVALVGVLVVNYLMLTSPLRILIGILWLIVFATPVILAKDKLTSRTSVSILIVAAFFVCVLSPRVLISSFFTLFLGSPFLFHIADWVQKHRKTIEVQNENNNLF